MPRLNARLCQCQYIAKMLTQFLFSGFATIFYSFLQANKLGIEQSDKTFFCGLVWRSSGLSVIRFCLIGMINFFLLNLKGVFTSENVDGRGWRNTHNFHLIYSLWLQPYSLHFHNGTLPLILTLGYTVMTEDQWVVTKRFCWVYQQHKLRW